LNVSILIGRLVKTPELKVTNSNTPFTNFTIAVNRQFKSESGEQEADFINCIVWRKQAENLCKYQTKGNLIGVQGRIQTRNYEDNDGKTIYITEVVADSIQFLESKDTHPQTDEQADETFKHGNPTNKPSIVTPTSRRVEREKESGGVASSEDLPF
jgi:single-strand DNA-binding protein